MKYSRLFGKTLRHLPQTVRPNCHALLVKGGYVHSLGQGLFSLLPLGMKLMQNVQAVVDQELQAMGGQQSLVPLVNPLELWARSGRQDWIDQEMLRLQDRYGRHMVLSPTHEEAFVELVRQSLSSYRDIPVFLYQYQLKYRDEERPRGGLLRSREFTMNDGYSFHRSFSELNNFFPKMFTAYNTIFRKLGMKTVIGAESGVGYMGGSKAYDFLLPSETGEEIIVRCPGCGYQASRKIAYAIKDYRPEAPASMRKVNTPDCRTMQQLANFLDKPLSSLAKTMVYTSRNGLVMAVVRADYDVSTEKLSRLLGRYIYGLASVEQLKERKLIPGYLSPLGMEEELSDIPVVIDDAVANTPNLVFGANEEGYHFADVNVGLDFESSYVGDIVKINGNDYCIQCGQQLEEVRAIELGSMFKLDDFYARRMGLSFHDENGKIHYPYMGSYGIGLTRLLAASVEVHHDERGLVWPWHLAPYKIFLMSIGKSLTIKQITRELAEDLGDMVLHDDRDESVGVKFKDAELLGIPLRIVVSRRHINERKVEFCLRKSRKKWLVPLENVREEIEKIKKEDREICLN